MEGLSLPGAVLPFFLASSGAAVLCGIMTPGVTEERVWLCCPAVAAADDMRGS